MHVHNLFKLLGTMVSGPNAQVSVLAGPERGAAYQLVLPDAHRPEPQAGSCLLAELQGYLRSYAGLAAEVQYASAEALASDEYKARLIPASCSVLSAAAPSSMTCL